MHLATYLAEVLLAQGQSDRALIQVEKALATARDTGSQKYLAKAHLLRGRIAVAGRDWARGETDLRQAVSIARRIEYPNLIWPAAHALAAALATRAESERTARAKGDEVHALSSLASETISSIADRAPDADLRGTFLAWAPVEKVLGDLERLRRT
jgi:tetratricopeptide (TPR) repeat protein